MALDPTLSEVAFQKSIKKFFVDNLATAQGYFVDFDLIYKDPNSVDDTSLLSGAPIDRWFIFHIDGPNVNNSVARATVNAFMFLKGAMNGSELSELRDALVDLLTDLDMPDGTKRIPLYDTTLTTVVGHMLVKLGEDSTIMRASDKTYFKVVPVTLTYGAK